MSEDIKNLVEQLSVALGDVLRESGKVRDILRKIEEAGVDTNTTLAIVLGVHGQNTEVHKIVYGKDRQQGVRASQRRVSAFDRRFLRALRIQLPE